MHFSVFAGGAQGRIIPAAVQVWLSQRFGQLPFWYSTPRVYLNPHHSFLLTLSQVFLETFQTGDSIDCEPSNHPGKCQAVWLVCIPKYILTKSTVRHPRGTIQHMDLSPRAELLQAARRLMKNQPIAYLTLEAVAKEAGMSKGGLSHYFPSKEALLNALVNDMLEQFDQLLSHSTEPDWIRAYIQSSFDQPTSDVDALTMLNAVVINPDLLEPVQQRYIQWQAQLEQAGMPSAYATLVRLALDGLMLADLFGLAPPNQKARQELKALLLELVLTQRKLSHQVSP
jgi:AcrR family transcriptional regulator